MPLTSLLVPIGILAGIGVLLGGTIAVVNRKFWVWEDPRIDEAEGMLPGNNCGACGLPGCRAFAEGLVAGRIAPAQCTVMGPEDRGAVASLLGVEAGQAEKRVARLLCAGGSDVAPRKAIYEGAVSCAAAVAVTGGGKACPWGCVGLADCAISCDFDAIRMNDVDLPVVDPELCTACGDCVEACPLDLFTLMPMSQRLIVQCRNLLEGKPATELCAVACDACGRCAMDAAAGLIEMRDGLPVIDYSRNELAGPEATARCPTGAIQWVIGRQFEAPGATEDMGGRDDVVPIRTREIGRRSRATAGTT
jgi:Na+-translocating ferredoxin:NAD+ oxidoreductase RNF subunit RnfB